MKTRKDILLDSPNGPRGSGLARLDAEGYRAYSWERGITVPGEPMNPLDADRQVDRELAYALNVIFND